MPKLGVSDDKRKFAHRLAKHVEAGFGHRLADLNAVLRAEQRDLNFEVLGPDQINLRSFSNRFLPSSLTLSEYIKHLEPLLPIQYGDLLLGYYFSGEYVSDPSVLIHSSFYNEAQLSVVMQTLYLNGQLQNYPGVINKIELGLSEIVKTLRQWDSDAPIESFERFLKRLGIALASPIASISQFTDCLLDAKQRLVHVLGPDIFTLFLQLCDPSYCFSETAISKAVSICQRWDCVDLFVIMSLIRATRNTDKDAGTLEAVVSRKKGPVLLSETINAWSAWDSNIRCSISDIAQSPLTGATQLCAVRAAISSQIPETLVNELIELYELDPELLEWIDWDAVYQVLKKGKKQEGLKIAIVHLIMGRPSVARKFPYVNMAIGDGAFGSSLRTAVSKLSNRSPAVLAEEISKLPKRSRELIVKAVIDQDTVVTLAILFGYDPPWARKLVQTPSLTHDVRASALRSDLANTFAKHGLLDQTRALEMIEEERSRLRVAYLQGRQLQGLVHIEWGSLAEQLEFQFGGQIALVRRLLRVPELENPEFYLSNVVAAIADSILKFVVVDGPEDINTTVSDSLRHGQLPNRFLRAFDEAIAYAVAAPLDISAVISELQAVTSPHPHWLLYLRNLLVSEIRSFNEEYLAVSPPSAFYDKALSVITEQIKILVESQRNGEIADCLSSIRVCLDEFLVDARCKLKRKITWFLEQADLVRSATTAGSADLSPAYGPPLDRSSFLNALHDKMDEALLDATRWMAVAVSQESPEAFHLSDLVELCLLNYRSGDSRDISVDTEVSDRRASQGIVIFRNAPLISGRYFELMENLVKNLLSNAFKHSGQGLHSRVSIELIHAPDWLILRSRNTISPAKYEQLKAVIGQLTAQANRDTLAGAGKDDGSGLQKVRWARNRWLNSVPQIRLQAFTRGAVAGVTNREVALQRGGTHPFAFEIQIDVRHRHGSLLN